MALNYANFRLLAERLINENGRTMTLVRRDQGNPVDPGMPWRASTNASEITVPVTAVFIEYEKDEVDGTLVKRGDKRLLVASKDIDDAAPANVRVEDYDEVLDAGVSWRIVTVNTIEPGNTRILYDIQARQ